MENTVYFLAQMKRTNGVWDKGIVVKFTGETAQDNYEAALQSYHAYLGAYAYGHDPNTDYVGAYIMDPDGNRPVWEVWKKRTAPEPESEVEPEET